HATPEREAAGGVARALPALCACTSSLDLTLDQTSVLLLERSQSWKGRAHGDLVRIAGVDAGDERIDRVIQELAAQAALDERSDRFFGVLSRPRDERLTQEPQFRSRGECPRCE